LLSETREFIAREGFGEDLHQGAVAGKENGVGGLGFFALFSGNV
jgi:hypothetical protein